MISDRSASGAEVRNGIALLRTGETGEQNAVRSETIQRNVLYYFFVAEKLFQSFVFF